MSHYWQGLYRLRIRPGVTAFVFLLLYQWSILGNFSSRTRLYPSLCHCHCLRDSLHLNLDLDGLLSIFDDRSLNLTHGAKNIRVSIVLENLVMKLANLVPFKSKKPVPILVYQDCSETFRDLTLYLKRLIPLNERLHGSDLVFIQNYFILDSLDAFHELGHHLFGLDPIDLPYLEILQVVCMHAQLLFSNSDQAFQTFRLEISELQAVGVLSDIMVYNDKFLPESFNQIVPLNYSFLQGIKYQRFGMASLGNRAFNIFANFFKFLLESFKLHFVSFQHIFVVISYLFYVINGSFKACVVFKSPDVHLIEAFENLLEDVWSQMVLEESELELLEAVLVLYLN